MEVRHASDSLIILWCRKWIPWKLHMTQVLSFFQISINFFPNGLYPLYLTNGTPLVIIAWFITGLNELKLWSIIWIRDAAIPVICSAY